MTHRGLQVNGDQAGIESVVVCPLAVVASENSVDSGESIMRRNRRGILAAPFSFISNLRDSKSRRRKEKRPLAHFRRLALEGLEHRILPTGPSLVGVPDWIEQGPGPIVNTPGQVGIAEPNTGEVQAIVIDNNTSPRTTYIGTQGGVWKTTDDLAAASATNLPTWTPLTDKTGLTDNNTYSLAIDPLDHNTVYAGSFGSVLKTTD